MSHRKIPATRGFYWCVEAWRNFRASPQPIFSMAMWLSLGSFLPVLNLLVVVLLTVFYGGVISALHKRALGERIWLGDFFNGFKSTPRFLGLFMAGLPTVLLMIFIGLALSSVLSPETLEILTKSGQPPSKEAMAALETMAPAFVGVMLKLLPIGIVAGWIVFLAVPRVMLDKRMGLMALWDALRALFANIGALLLFSATMFAAIIFFLVLMSIPIALISGSGALAGVLQTFMIVFISTMYWALYLHAMYIAWRDIFMSEVQAPHAEAAHLPSAQIEV